MKKLLLLFILYSCNSRREDLFYYNINLKLQLLIMIARYQMINLEDLKIVM